MANGTIAFDTLSTSGQISGTAKSLDTDYVVSGVTKGFLFSKGAAPAAQGKSLNISSIADTAAGNFQITLTSAMSDNNPTVTVSQYQNQALGNALVYNSSQTLSSTNVPIATYNGSSAATDYTNGVATIVHGDLA